MPDERSRARKPELGTADHRFKPELGRAEPDHRLKPELGAPSQGMVYVPAGEFLMGTTDAEARRVLSMDPNVTASWMDDEKPQRRVYLDAYLIGVSPVTVAEYRAFCEAAGRRVPAAPSWGWQEDHPVANVSWHDAAVYCAWAGKRLPTEAEWERAARGVKGGIFPWGNEWNERAAHCDWKHKCEWIEGTWIEKTAPVGAHPEGMSPVGCQDMVGNVWEWCADWYDAGYYGRAPGRNPRGPASGSDRVLRGGSWRSGNIHYWLRGAARHNFRHPDCFRDEWGFRCVQDPA